MKKVLCLLISLLITNTIFAQVLSGPESIEWDQANTRWLVGNSSGGTILARSTSGTLTNFVSGLPSGPYGLEILGDKVFACSGGFIRGYSLSDGANVFNLNLNASFLNGLTSDGVNFLYATDFSAKKIFKIDISNISFTTIATGLVKTPNGILCEPENNRCLIVNWGSNAPILAIDLTTNAISTVLATTLGNCDGITKDSCGNYYITAWSNNKLNKFNPSLTGNFTVIPGNLSSPADIDCRFGTTFDTVGIPGGGAISFIELTKPNPIISNNSNSLSTSTTFDNYQWFQGQTPISGANQQSFIPTSNGNYTCAVNYGTCTFVSNTITVSTLSNAIFEGSNNDLFIYPNPANNKITIEGISNSNTSYILYNISGKIISKGDLNNSNITIDISRLQKGTYFLKTFQESKSQTLSFIKE